MFTDNNKSQYSSIPVDEAQIKPMNNLVDFTDRSVDRTFRFFSKFFSDYEESWAEGLDNTTCSFPPWREHWKEHRDRKWGCRRKCNREEGGEVYKLGQSPSLVGGLNGDNSAWQLSGNNSLDPTNSIPLDKSKPSNLWAFPVPTTKQHDKCEELNGQGVWTREGVWRCLFPLDNLQVQRQVQIGSADSKAPTSERKLFGDYTDYLDWKSAIRKAMREKEERDRAIARIEHDKQENERQEYIRQVHARKEQERIEAERQAREHWTRQQERIDADRQLREQFARQQELVRKEKEEHLAAMRSQQQQQQQQWEPVRNLDKTVVSTSTTSETVTKEDGTSETKQIIQKWYKDGTSTVTERVTTAPPTADGKGRSGWFWK